MNATRTIPGRPIRSGTEVADAIANLVASTLDPSPHIATESVRTELAAALSALALFASGGYLADDALVLTAADLRLVINVPVGETALTATENIAAPRGAASATDWALYLPTPGGMAALAESAASACPHLSTNPAPTSAAQSRTTATSLGIDLAGLLDRDNR